MLQILLHSSKTMSSQAGRLSPLCRPLYSKEAAILLNELQSLSTIQLSSLMKISEVKAVKVKAMHSEWSTEQSLQLPAIDAFKGDIYSGLQVSSWSENDRRYANEHLLILSGLYGVLRPDDGIMPYRLEMGYKLPSGQSLYSFWGNKLAKAISLNTESIIDLSAVEYTKALLPYTDKPVITPKFMTIRPKTGRPAFVTVHAKIARGALARWLILNRVNKLDGLLDFSELGYVFDSKASSPKQPVFICQEFQGKGLSVRLAN